MLVLGFLTCFIKNLHECHERQMIGCYRAHMTVDVLPHSHHQREILYYKRGNAKETKSPGYWSSFIKVHLAALTVRCCFVQELFWKAGVRSLANTAKERTLSDLVCESKMFHPAVPLQTETFCVLMFYWPLQSRLWYSSFHKCDTVTFSCTQKEEAENWSGEQMASPSVWYF